MKHSAANSFIPQSLACVALGASLACAGCGDNREPITDEPLPPPAPTLLAYALATDYASPGILTQLELLRPSVLEDVVSGVAASDPVLIAQGDELIVVNRFGGDSVTILKRDPLQLVAQVSTGVGSNPQDVARVGGLYYVPLYGGAGVAVLDAEAADISDFSVIDLAALDPVDSLPDCSAVLPQGEGALVICQRLEGFAAVKPAVVARVAVGEATVSQELAELNPNTLMVKTPEASFFAGRILVGTAPSFVDPTAGCVVAIHPETLANECVISNEELGGSAIRMAVTADGQTMWVAVSGTIDFANPIARLVPVNLATGAVGAPISAAGQVITDVATCADGHIMAADSAAGSKGIRLFRDGAEVTTAPLDIGLPPAFTNAMVCQ